MARRRLRAASRKQHDHESHTIATGVYAVARDLQGREMPLPLQVTAPLVYVCEMLAAVVCKQRGWADQARMEQVARYLMQGFQETAVALFKSFDEEHFAAWITAAQARQGV